MVKIGKIHGPNWPNQPTDHHWPMHAGGIGNRDDAGTIDLRRKSRHVEPRCLFMVWQLYDICACHKPDTDEFEFPMVISQTPVAQKNGLISLDRYSSLVIYVRILLSHEASSWWPHYSLASLQLSETKQTCSGISQFQSQKSWNSATRCAEPQQYHVQLKNIIQTQLAWFHDRAPNGIVLSILYQNKPQASLHKPQLSTVEYWICSFGEMHRKPPRLNQFQRSGLFFQLSHG